MTSDVLVFQGVMRLTCPERERSNHWQAADIPSWAFQFAHFIPSKRSDGWGCSNGPELDVAPPRRGAYTPLGALERTLSCWKPTHTDTSKGNGRLCKRFFFCQFCVEEKDRTAKK